MTDDEQRPDSTCLPTYHPKFATTCWFVNLLIVLFFAHIYVHVSTLFAPVNMALYYLLLDGLWFCLSGTDGCLPDPWDVRDEIHALIEICDVNRNSNL